MLISNKFRYAMLAIIDIALNVNTDKKNVKIQEISKRQNISKKYLESIMTVLVQKRILDSFPGSKGGYSLSGDISNLTLLDVIVAIDKDIIFTRCKDDNTGCLENGAKCAVHNIWIDLQDEINTLLRKTKLGELILKYKQKHSNQSHRHVYFDSNATVPLDDNIRNLIIQNTYYNASSIHKLGQSSRAIVEESRDNILKSLGAELGYKLVFTSSATEANYLVGNAFDIDNFFCSSIEHLSVLENLPDVSLINVDCDGVVCIDELVLKIDDTRNSNKKFIVSIMFVNNETGVIQDIKYISQIVHEKGGLLHVDAVQVYCRMPIAMNELDVDIMTISGHKVGAGFGVGALIFRDCLQFKRVIKGGHQEYGLRSGTENIPAIHALGEIACNVDHKIERFNQLTVLHDNFENQILKHIPEAIVCSKNTNRIGNTTCIIIPNIANSLQIMYFDMHNVSISNGSACSSGDPKPSYVLKAMGYSDDKINCAIRISSNCMNNSSDFEYVVKILIIIYNKLKILHCPIEN